MHDTVLDYENIIRLVITNNNLANEILKQIDEKTCEIILNKCLNYESRKRLIPIIVSKLNKDVMLKIIENWKYPHEYLFDLFELVRDLKIYNYIINNSKFDLLQRPAFFQNLIDLISENNYQIMCNKIKNESTDLYEIKFPQYKLNIDFFKKIWESFNIFDLRCLLNKCDNCFDTTDLNRFISQKEEEDIQNFFKTGYVSLYKDIYDLCKTLKEIDKIKGKMKWKQEYNSLDCVNCSFALKKLELYSNMYPELKDLITQFLGYNFEYEINTAEMDDEEFLDKLSHEIRKMASNYIIDYHFKECFHNVIIDIQELLNFHFTNHINLPEERVELYTKILQIDKLSNEELLKLHNELKTMNIMEIFYDDMSYSRKMVGQLLKESSLARESLAQYEDKELTEKYGVPVYRIEDNPFFAIIKSGRSIDSYPTGHSFSIIGAGGIGHINGYGDTFLYDAGSLMPEQVIHIYPFDSFTLYQPFEFQSKASYRINALLSPEEIMAQTANYNELLLLEKGRIKTDMDDAIPTLQKIALYCVDRISENDVRIAEKNGVGIFLINSNNLSHGKDAEKRPYRPQIKFKDSYYSISEREEFESTR